MTDQIWILIPKPNFSSGEIHKAGKKQRLKISHHNSEEFSFLSDISHGDLLFHKNKLIDFPKIVITRNKTGRTYHSAQLLSVLEKNGVICMNTARGINLANDKWKTIQQLNKKKITHPRSMLLEFPTDIKLIKKYFTRPVVIKRTSGMEGKGLILVKNRSQMEDLFNILEKSINIHSRFLVQEFIKFSSGQDIRVIVIGGKAISALRRIGKKNKFQSNVGLGGKAIKIEINDQMKKIAEESALALGLDFAGVDLLITEDGYKVCEVNASPGGFAEFKKINGVDIAQTLIDYVVSKLVAK